MYYLVCYQLETAVAIDDDGDLKNLNSASSLRLKKFLQKVGKLPVIKIDKNYPSYGAVLDNYYIIGERNILLH